MRTLHGGGVFSLLLGFYCTCLLFPDAQRQAIAPEVFIKVHVVTSGKIIQGIESKGGSTRHPNVPGIHRVHVEILVVELVVVAQLIVQLIGVVEEGDDLVLLAVDLLALVVDAVGPVVHVVLVAVLAVQTASTH